MFKILTKNLNIHELRLLAKLWDNMRSFLDSSIYCNGCCSECDYKRLCNSLSSTQKYLDKALEERNSHE